MMEKHVFSVLVCLVAFLHPSKEAVDRGYVFTMPQVLLAGEVERGCLSLHNLEPPAAIRLDLLSPSMELMSSTSFKLLSGAEICLELGVPSTEHTTAYLRLQIRIDHLNYVVEAEEKCYIEHDSLLTFVETDKAVYKPGQDVNIRIVMLKHDLKIWKESIPKVWIENPSEIRVAQWTNVNTENGMAQLLFPLSPEQSSGTWKIKVEKKISHSLLIHTATFEVTKYVLQRFQVTVKSPGYILADADNVTWTVCAKYSYGKPVKGTLRLKSISQLPNWRGKVNLLEIDYETKVVSPDGCTDFVVSGSDLGLDCWQMTPDSIVLIANFTEAGTGVVESTISQTMVVNQALKLEFLPHTPKYFKQGLPYHGKLRVLRQDNTPAPNEKIQLCLQVLEKGELRGEMVECHNFRSAIDGFIDFVVPPRQKNIVELKFIATGVDYPTKYYSPDKRWWVFMDQPLARIIVPFWYSPSGSYLGIARGNQPIVCGEKYSFNVMYTTPVTSHINESISFHCSINSKGGLLIHGHVKHKPTKDTILNYSEFRNLLGAGNSSVNSTKQSTVVHRFPLSVKVTPGMAPVSELLLYYVRADGEVVAATYTIEVGHCFENKVKSAWHTGVQIPGATTQYHVEAAPWSSCSISAVDKSTRFMAGSKKNLMEISQTFDELKQFHSMSIRLLPRRPFCKLAMTTQVNSSMEEIDHLPSPAIKLANSRFEAMRRRHFTTTPIDVSYLDSTQAFIDFGVVTMSDLVLTSRPCVHHETYADLMTEKIMHMNSAGLDTVKIMQPTAVPLINYRTLDAAGTVEVDYFDHLADRTATLRSYFPETWLWELVPAGKEGKVTIERTLPHTITDWIGYTTCISPIHGLGIAPPTTITAFQPFFLDYTLPYSVKRGEMLHLKVSLFNYMQHRLPVKIKLEEATGLDLHLSHPTASFCVNSRDSVVHEFILRPRVLGEVNITVSASVNPDFEEPCGPETLVFTRDAIVKPILVLPEGYPVEKTKSTFICPKEFSDDSTIVWDLILPKDVVPNSGRAYVSLIGDILGPALENLDKLVQLPMGCGEQNMVLFVPNIHVIKYLGAIGIENSTLRARAIKNMEKGYQRELNYRHPDGSYSAFGAQSSEDEGSIWLTAFVLKSFAQARGLIHIDEHDLSLSARWIFMKQLENGCFPVVGRVFHKAMKGGLEDDSSSTALTAYILISFIESGLFSQWTSPHKAVDCIRLGLQTHNENLYTLALATYAFTLLGPTSEIYWMVSLLMNRATRHNDLLWWEDKSKPSLSLSIEITAYAVLTLIKLGGEVNMVHALKAIRWMSKQRNAEGGFSSTQDTILALEALTKFPAAMNNNNTDLSVLVTASEVDHVYRMHNDNRMVLTQIQLPILPTIVEIFAEGEGCVLVQSNIKYNVAHTTGSDAFDLSVMAHSGILENECSVQKITICARYKIADRESNMAVAEVGMISGYAPDRTSLYSLLGKPSSKVKRFEEDRDVVSIYFDKLTDQETCISFMVMRETVVDSLEPANVKLYDYYQPELTVSSSYNFAPICSSADPVEKIDNFTVVQLFAENLDDMLLLTEENFKNRSVEKSVKNLATEDANNRNKMINRISEANRKSPSSRGPNLLNILRDNIDEDSIAGVRPMTDNVPFVEKSDPKIGEDTVDIITRVRTTSDNTIFNPSNILQVESGSGLTPDEPDRSHTFSFDNVDLSTGIFSNIENPSTVPVKEIEDLEVPGNPSFVVVSHELETPEGIEGPIPVYTKSDAVDYKTETTSSKNSLFHSSPPVESDDISQKELDNQTIYTTNSNMQVTSLTRANQACPTCIDKLPLNISDVYCSANAAVKVAIRRLRKARLLIDLNASREVQRLRTTVKFTLDPSCSCSLIDSPGTFALIINKENDFVSSHHSSGDHRQTLDNTFNIYGLPIVTGVPPEIAEARRSSCSNLEENQPAGD